MKAVIIGAGASFDSIHDFYEPRVTFDVKNKPPRSELAVYFDQLKGLILEQCPPLAKDLFGTRRDIVSILNKYPQAEGISGSISLSNDIEEYLDQLIDQIDETGDCTLFTQIISVQYFLRDLFLNISKNYSRKGKSNFDALVNSAYRYSTVTDEEIIFINFNYDTLLEQSLTRLLNIKFENINDYTSSKIKVYKPHGSCNWVKTITDFEVPVGHPPHAADIFCMRPEFYSEKYWTNSLKDQEIIIRNDESSIISIQKDNRDYYIMPQLTVPIVKKATFLLPDDQLNQLTEQLKNIDSFLIIGWRGSEQNFIKLLHESIGDKNTHAQFVIGDANLREHNLCTNFPNIRSTQFSESYFIQTQEDGSYIPFFGGKGSFSAYTIQSLRKPETNFFTTVAHEHKTVNF